MSLRKGSNGTAVRDLQLKLKAAGASLVVDGWFGDATQKAIEQFQDKHDLPRTGYAGVRTLALLAGESRSKFIQTTQLIEAAKRLSVQFAAMASVAEVESNGFGFFACGRPSILFERHVFYRELFEQGEPAAELAAKYPNICNQARGGYIGGSGEYQRFAIAYQLNPEAAICACSWGMFQIMGFHWQALGYLSPQAFKQAMDTSEGEQLNALVKFIEADPILHKTLKARKWAEFAKRYNGPAYKENDYDIKLARAYQQFNTVFHANTQDADHVVVA
ncbi:N-acetylmuramidase family protein [Shewanella xiamenensis]|uniref:N-acetylmuramidase family protein n=1 Tax=Shewanella xiamenensis TaxID=332186 RepID=UPI0021C09F04|nr:N-acetylmuramidase family protein [Shewanella xiamenensis]MCT8866920.1 N-acetylmuramidase family protein [Shewanella xiamenensis]